MHLVCRIQESTTTSELLYFCQQHLCLNDVQWREKKNLKSESKAAEANMSKDYAPQPKR